MRGLLMTVLLLAVVAVPASASAKTVTKNVPATVVYLNGQNPNDPGNCSAVAFVQWAHVDRSVAAKANYIRRGKPATEYKASPFDNTYKLVYEYKVPAGYDWIAISRGWSDGPRVNDCSATREKLKTIVGGPATVDVSIEIDPKLCTAAQKTLTKRQAAVTKLQKRVNKAKGKEKTRLKKHLKAAKASRTKAQAKVTELC